MRLNISKEIFFTRDGLLDQILNNTFEQSVIVDKNANIIFFSRGSENYSRKNSSQMIGQSIKNHIPDHGFDKVLQSGVADKGVLINLDGNISISHHIPVFSQDELIGAIGIIVFSSLDTVKRFLAALSNSGNQEHIELYNQVSRHISKYSFNNYIGEHPLVKQLLEQAQIAAESDLPVLIIGETGTGKEIIASGIHANNKKTFLNPFVTVNCSAIPGDLLESEMFGHEKGAFTGATATKKGKFELAGKGSILLDEIGDMDILLQTKLLRVLEEREFERVGGTRLLPTGARIIAATNADLPKLCDEKKFRNDLYYRLNTLELYIPPLRARSSDIPLLTEHFIADSQYEIKFSNEALEIMMNYNWPGNIRQLKNIISRFGVFKKGQIIQDTDVKEVFHCPSASNRKEPNASEDAAALNHPSDYDDLMDIEKSTIENALKECKNNQSLAAQKLNISRSTLIRKIKAYNIDLFK